MTRNVNSGANFTPSPILPPAFQDRLINEGIRENSTLRPFTNALGFHDAFSNLRDHTWQDNARLRVQIDEEGQVSVTYDNADQPPPPNDQADILAQNIQTRLNFYDALADECGQLWTDYSQGTFDVAENLSEANVRLYTSLGILYRGTEIGGENIAAAPLLIAVVRRVFSAIQEGSLDGPFKDTALAHLSLFTAWQLCQTEFSETSGPDNQVAVFMRHFLQAIPFRNSDLYEVCARIYEDNGHLNDVPFLHKFYSLIREELEEALGTALHEIFAHNAVDTEPQNQIAYTLPNIAIATRSHLDVPDEWDLVMELVDKIQKAPIDNCDKIDALNISFASDFDEEITDGYIEEQSRDKYAFANVIFKENGIDIAGALLAGPDSEPVAQEVRYNQATEVFSQFLQFQPYDEFEYTPKQKAFILAEGLFRDAASLYFTNTNNSASQIETEDAHNRAVEELEAAASTLEGIGATENGPLDTSAQEAATLAARVVRDLAGVRMRFAEVRNGTSRAELAPFIYGSALLPKPIRYVNILEDDIPDNIINRHELGELKAALLYLSEIEKSISTDENFDWPMVIETFEEEFHVNLNEEGWEPLENAGINGERFSIYDNAHDILVDWETSVLSELLTETTEFIRSTTPSILTDYTGSPEDDYIDLFQDEQDEDGSELLGLKTAMLDQLAHLERRVKTATSVWADQDFHRRLDGVTAEAMTEYGICLIDLHLLFQAPNGPIAGLRHMITEAAKDPVLFAARLNA